MTTRRLNEIFNRITYAAILATILLLSLSAIDWSVMYFGMVN